MRGSTICLVRCSWFDAIIIDLFARMPSRAVEWAAGTRRVLSISRTGFSWEESGPARRRVELRFEPDCVMEFLVAAPVLKPRQIDSLARLAISSELPFAADELITAVTRDRSLEQYRVTSISKSMVLHRLKDAGVSPSRIDGVGSRDLGPIGCRRLARLLRGPRLFSDFAPLFFSMALVGALLSHAWGEAQRTVKIIDAENDSIVSQTIEVKKLEDQVALRRAAANEVQSFIGDQHRPRSLVALLATLADAKPQTLELTAANLDNGEWRLTVSSDDVVRDATTLSKRLMGWRITVAGAIQKSADGSERATISLGGQP